MRGGGGPGAERGARCFLFSLRSRRLLAGRAGFPGRPHYAGGLPAAAMASRTVVRAGRSPYHPRVRAAAAAPAGAALPRSQSCPRPPRSRSSSPPMPPSLLLLLVLLLLLEDAGAQQGEWFPGSARRGESPRGAGAAGLGAPGRCGTRLRCEGRRGGRSPGGVAKLGSACCPPAWRGVTFLARPFIFLKRGERDPAVKASFLVLDYFSRENLWGEEKDVLET